MLNSRIKNLISVVLAASMSLSVISSCKKKDTDFPSLEYPENITEQTSDTIPSESSLELTEISIASPYSSETINLLVRFYYAKCNGLLPEGVTGADVTEDYLGSIDIPWGVSSLPTASEGAGISSLIQWDEEGRMPDLVLVQDVEAAVDTGLIVPYDEYLSDSSLINGNSIYPEALLQNSIGGNTYALPFYQTVMLIAGNRDYIPEAGVLPFRSSTEEFEEYLEDLQAEYQDQDLVIFAGGYELLPYLSSSFNGDNRTSYMFLDDMSLSQSVEDSVDYIEELYDRGLTSDTDINGADPRISRTACLWLTSSDRIDMLNEYYPDSLYYSMIPSDSGESLGIPYASVYSICLTDSSANKEFASDFAAFMCFDVDAQMLLSRLEPQRGYFPCLTSSALWDIVCDDEVFGTEAMLFEQMMPRAVYCPGMGSSLQSEVEIYNMNYYASYLNGDNPTYNPEDIIQ